MTTPTEARRLADELDEATVLIPWLRIIADLADENERLVANAQRVVDAAIPLAWDTRWGRWLAHMPTEQAREVVKLRVPLQDALAEHDKAAT